MWKSKRLNDSTVQIDIDLNKKEDEFGIYFCFDAHWDNPKCNREMLKRHFDYAKEKGYAVLFGGDLFCAMQGKADRRGVKSDIRPEHNTATYFDSLVETAVDWFKPYRDNIACVGYGNHESSILKHQETDLIKRFCDGMGIEARGGYGGYVILRFKRNGKVRSKFLIKYFHGSGGGGPVTKGVIQANRRQTYCPDADLIVTGHIHESWEIEYVTERVNLNTGKIIHRPIIHVQVPTYKEEYGDGTKGWHVERGAPPKPMGGKVLKVKIHGSEKDFQPMHTIERLT